MRALLVVCVLVSSLGCRVCQICDQYPAYGGSWQRTNRTGGRVGSIFDPAGFKASDTAQSVPIAKEPWTDEESEEVDTMPQFDATESESVLEELGRDLPDAPPTPLEFEPPLDET